MSKKNVTEKPIEPEQLNNKAALTAVEELTAPVKDTPLQDELIIDAPKKRRGRKKGTKITQPVKLPQDTERLEKMVKEMLDGLSKTVVALTQEPTTAMPIEISGMIEPPGVRLLEKLAPEVLDKVSSVSDPIIVITGLGIWAQMVVQIVREKNKTKKIGKLPVYKPSPANVPSQPLPSKEVEPSPSALLKEAD